MKLLLLVLAALLGAVSLGQFIVAHPGVVAISVDGTALRMSLSLFVVLVTVAGLVLSWLLHTLWRLLTLRARVRRWREARQRRRALERVESGLLALAAGDYARAERLLGRGSQRSKLQYLAAAQAAHAQQASERRDALLALAAGGTPEETLALGVRRAEMLLDDGNPEAAETALAPLLARHADNPAVLLLRQRLLSRTGREEELAALLPTLRKRKLHPPARLDELEAELAVRRLRASGSTPDALAQRWSGLGKTARQNPVVVAAYARALLALKAHAAAEEVLRKALDAHWDARLLALYGELDANDVRGALTRAERWRDAHPEDPGLLLALGRLCLSQRLWGKARGYLESLVALAPSALAWRLLADACEALGETALAERHRQEGLRYATAGSLGESIEVRRLSGVVEP